ncbi:MAG: hypothetical protein HYZ73_01455 [Elusimicrobia bacterium]|nr:hypothetical protein [Elusimicrobiota bacterium]
MKSARKDRRGNLFVWITLLIAMGISSWTTLGSTASLKKPTECLDCGVWHTSADHVVQYKGGKIYLCSDDCITHFQALERAGKLDPITAKIEPRSALFQEDSNPKGALSNAYFIGGLYVLFGLLFGGLSSYTALQKGLGGWPAFALGMTLNVIGLAIVWMRPKREMLFASKGLTKIPSTRQELICLACGHANHPSAKRCHGCQATLTPLTPSEVERVKNTR